MYCNCLSIVYPHLHLSHDINSTPTQNTLDMPLPVAGDFPSHATVVLSYPGSSDSTPPPTLTPQQASNVVVLLHGLGDTAAKFASFGRALNLPETICVTVQAPSPLPAGLVDQEAFHWGDDVMLDDGGLSMDAGFDRATKLIAREIIADTLVKKHGYKLRDILLVGLGQGGMAALAAARELGLNPPVRDELPEATLSSSTTTTEHTGSGNRAEHHVSLSGVVSFGGPYPLSVNAVGNKDRTPVLLLAGREGLGSDLSDTAVKRTKEAFQFVELHRWSRRGDGMPRNRDEMLPAMQFFARRLKSRKGVPAGSIELT
jgi:predicted esterase